MIGIPRLLSRAPDSLPAGEPSAPRPATLDRVARGARRIQTYCRQAVTDCVAVPVVEGATRRVALRVGPRRGRSGDHLWVRDLDPASLEDEVTTDRLARLIRVWLEPEG